MSRKPGNRVRRSRAKLPAFSLESLESRTLLSAAPSGLSPAQIRSAYGIATVEYTVGAQVFGATGRGQTIAIVDAYSDPNISADLRTFDAQYGLPNTDINKNFVLTIATPEGTPSADASWAQEISLDVEWAHAEAPKADILLVEAKSDSFDDLMNAVNYARAQTGVVAVSMSWGGYEFRGETAYDSDFTTPSGHIGGSGLAGGITFVTSSGDNGGVTSYPAASPNVLTVGGTTLTTDSAGDYISETAWSDSGGGVSRYEGTDMPDVAFNANPNTGYAVYDSDPYDGDSGWQVIGGTSAGAPQWAGLIADVDQGLNYLGQGSLDGATQTISDIYNLPSSEFHDITSGSNGRYTAGVGYDLVTGLGTPDVPNLISDLVGTSITGTVAHPAVATAAVATKATDAVVSPADVPAGAAGNNNVVDQLGIASEMNLL